MYTCSQWLFKTQLQYDLAYQVYRQKHDSFLQLNLFSYVCGDIIGDTSKQMFGLGILTSKARWNTCNLFKGYNFTACIYMMRSLLEISQ